MGLSDCRIIDLPKITTPRGDITIIEGEDVIPFKIERSYYCYNTPLGMNRGGHAHTNTHQLIIAIRGSFNVALDDGYEQKSYLLDKPHQGLYVAPMIWHEFNNFTSGAICLIFVSEYYCEEDTIVSYETFRKMVIE